MYNKKTVLIMIKEALKNNPLKNKFVARQPIFDRQLKIVGYELLFRSGSDNFFDELQDQEHASSRALFDSFFLFGMSELAGGKRLFINFTRKLLLSGVTTLLPRELVVIELLETIEPDSEILSVCKELKRKGFILALDDFVFRPEFRMLIEFLDIVKIDFMETKGEERKEIFQKIGRKNMKFLAEKIETVEDFNQAVELGYSYFQGYFFCKPIVFSTQDIPSLKSNLLMLIDKIYQPGINLIEVEKIITRDVSLAYKLFRFINSTAFGLTNEVRSIVHALTLMGFKELRKWISMVVLTQLSNEEPDGLMVDSIIRAQLSKLIAENIGMKERGAEFFLMGLFSLIDVFINRTMEDILRELPISKDIKEGLLEGKGVFGDVLHFVKSYEKGDWDIIFEVSSKLKLDEEIIPELYFNTIVWANALNKNSSKQENLLPPSL